MLRILFLFLAGTFPLLASADSLYDTLAAGFDGVLVEPSHRECRPRIRIAEQRIERELIVLELSDLTDEAAPASIALLGPSRDLELTIPRSCGRYDAFDRHFQAKIRDTGASLSLSFSIACKDDWKTSHFLVRLTDAGRISIQNLQPEPVGEGFLRRAGAPELCTYERSGAS
jgi:hypothetical protein